MKKTRYYVSLNWSAAFVDIVDDHAKRNGLTRARMIESVIQGLSAEQVDAAVKRGVKIIADNRAQYLSERKQVREALAKLTPAQVKALLKE